MNANLFIENLNRFIILVSQRFSKSDWSKLPLRSRNVFYGYKDLEKWVVKASLQEKFFFLSDINFDAACIIFPKNNLSVSDIPELSQYTFTIEDKIKSTERQLEKELFCFATRELAVYFYNLSSNSNSKYFALKQDFAILDEANEAYEKQNFKSAKDYIDSQNTREAILNFVHNLLVDLNGGAGELGLQEITILSFLRQNSETGVKAVSIPPLFKGSLKLRQIHNYLTKLIRLGYINRSGKKNETVYMLSSSGMLFCNDYAEHILNLK